MIKAMKGSTSSVCVALVLAILVLAPALMSARHIGRPRSHHGHHHHHHHHHTRSPRTTSNGDGGLMVKKPEMYHEIRRPSSLRKARRSPDPLEIAGSSLPDCSHACGSCSPCRLVMVSFVCASIEEAETCPMAYRCMCKHKSYPVP